MRATEITLGTMEKAIQNGSTFGHVELEINGVWYAVRKIQLSEDGKLLIFFKNNATWFISADRDCKVKATPISKPVSTLWQSLE